MSRRVTPYVLPLLLSWAPAICAQQSEIILEKPEDPSKVVLPSPWSGSSGELGFASAQGNSTTESFNAKLKGVYTDGDWIHSLDLSGLHSSAKYITTNDDGSNRRYRQTTANRYTGSAGSALQLGEHRQLTATGRYERDDFATYDHMASFGLGYGTRLLNRENAYLDAQFGPGVRRAHNTENDEYETGLIGRGVLDFKYLLTPNTQLVNTLLIESGSYNTFAQNDFGVSVSMNTHLALKAGWQARHNSNASEDTRNTDTLTTMNVVYTFK
jgi:putative salt-induced outer membrane protein